MKQFRKVSIASNSRTPTDSLIISAKLANDFDLESLQEIKLGVGQLKKTLNLKVNPRVKNRNLISLHPLIIRRLFLVSGRQYGLQIGEAEIQLGPVVGILAEIGADSQRPFLGQSYFFKQMIIASRSLGQICFGFSPAGINWLNNTVSGWTYTGGRWVRGTFPMPDVVYPRAKGYSAVINRARRGLKAHGVAISNPALIGKWQTFKILNQHPGLLPHVPDTRLVTSLRQVDAMMHKYRGVYIKPVNGSLGRNIIKVVKRPGSKRYLYHYRFNNRIHQGSAASMSTLRRKLYSIMGRRRYIVQKQIDLIRTRGNILDVRVLIQKDHSGEWSITGMACRVGKSGAITSNISSGGYALKVNSVLRSHFRSEAKVAEIISTIRYVALEAGQTLEKSIGPAGEMGIDIGVDREGKIWFIEANLKPGRQVFRMLHEHRTRRMTVLKPLLYARYLAGFVDENADVADS
ncbi:MAG: YheC/YheD family protein [Syntrophomonadaceae bacterium]|jgi:hypothetical protein